MWSSLRCLLRDRFPNSIWIESVKCSMFRQPSPSRPEVFIMATVRTVFFVPVVLIVPFVAAAMLVSSGCETVKESGIPGLRPDLTKKYEANRIEQDHRDNFVVHRDHKSLYWLIANRVQNGMSLTDAEQILGEPGERETDMSRLKLGGHYQTTDLVYKWGPDSEGYSVVLIFRDGHLVNFDPSGFRSP